MTRRKYFIIGCITIAFLLIPTVCNAAYSKTVSEILGEARKEMTAIREKVQASEEIRPFQEGVISGMKDLYQVFTGKKCVRHWTSLFSTLGKEFLGGIDFLNSWYDVWRNACFRDDIWDIEDMLEKVTELSLTAARQCTPETEQIMDQVSRLYTSLEADLDLLREFGQKRAEIEIVEKKNFLKKNGYFDKFNESDSKIQLKLAYQYAQPEVYSTYHKEQNPEGCRQDVFSDLEERIERLSENIKNMGDDLFSKESFEKDMKEAEKRGQERADKFFRGITAKIDLGFVRLEFAQSVKKRPEIGEDSNQKTLEKGRFIALDFGDDFAKIFGWITAKKTVEELIEDDPFLLLQDDLIREIRKEDRKTEREKIISDREKKFLLMFSETSNQIAQNLENKLVLLDACVQRAYTEKNKNSNGNIGCTLKAEAGGRPRTIIPLDENTDYKNPDNKYKSLPNFIKALDKLTSLMCVGNMQCIIPANWRHASGQVGSSIFK